MPLNWTTVSVPLVGGLDTKSDEKTVLPTKLTELMNGEFTKGGSVRKRAGYRQIRAETYDRSTITGAKGVFARDTGLVLATKSSLYNYEDVTGRYVRASNYDAMSHTAEEVAFTAYQQTLPNMASAQGVTVVAWQDSRGGVRGTIFNTETGAPYKADWEIATANALRPKVVAIGGNILVLWYNDSTFSIQAKVLATADVTGSLDDAAVDVVTDAHTTAASGIFDVVSGGDQGYLVYNSDGTTSAGTRLCFLNGAGVTSGHVAPWGADANVLALEYVSATGEVAVVYQSTASTAVQDWRFNASTLVNEVSATIGNYSNVTNVAMAPGADDDVHVAIEQSAGANSNYTVTVENKLVRISGSYSGSVTIYRHAGLVSSGFRANGNPYFILTHESRTGLQHSYYLVRGHDGIMGRVLSGEGVGIVGKSLSRVASVGDTFQCVLGFRRKLDINAENQAVPTKAVYTHKGVKLVTFDPTASPQGAAIEKTLYLGGSQLWAFDGTNSVESGFHMFPDLLASDITNSATVDADIPSSGTFNYRVYYEWTAANGERMRSAAITRTSPTLNGNQVQLVIPTLSFTNKQGDVSDVSIVVYRTEQNASVLYYRVSSPDPTATGANGYLANDPSVDTVTFLDGMSDTDLITKDWDYLSLGEQPNFAPESPEHVSVAQGRLWLAGGGQRPNSVRYSKPHFDATAVDFSNDGFITDAPDYGGKTQAVSHVNDVVVVFKEHAIYALEGEGPDSTGQNGFYRVRPISTDTGCKDPGSVYPHSDGVYFKSAEGIYLLGQDFQLQYVGADVEAYNGQTIVSTLGIPNTDQIVFLTSSGRTLMYDTFYRQWSTFTNHAGLGATVWKDTDYVYLRTDGTVYRRDSAVYTDAGVGYKLKFRTAPLRLTELLQGYWRCRKIGVLGEYKSSHRLKVGVYYNRDQAPFETFEWTPDDVLELGTWGSLATWGATGTVWGGTIGSRDYRFTHRLKRQKCETIRFEFEDLSTGATPGASFELTELALEVGHRDGLGRIPATRKV